MTVYYITSDHRSRRCYTPSVDRYFTINIDQICKKCFFIFRGNKNIIIKPLPSPFLSRKNFQHNGWSLFRGSFVARFAGRFFQNIQGQSFFCGQCPHPYILANKGSMTYEFTIKAITSISKGKLKSTKRYTIPSINGISHNGTMNGICFLNLSENLVSGCFSLNLAEMLPYPHGQRWVSKYWQ